MIVGCDAETFRRWAWSIVRSIAQLKERLVSGAGSGKIDNTPVVSDFFVLFTGGVGREVFGTEEEGRSLRVGGRDGFTNK